MPLFAKPSCPPPNKIQENFSSQEEHNKQCNLTGILEYHRVSVIKPFIVWPYSVQHWIPLPGMEFIQKWLLNLPGNNWKLFSLCKSWIYMKWRYKWQWSSPRKHEIICFSFRICLVVLFYIHLISHKLLEFLPRCTLTQRWRKLIVLFGFEYVFCVWWERVGFGNRIFSLGGVLTRIWFPLCGEGKTGIHFGVLITRS